MAVALITLIAVKHLALGFCLCNEELFVSDCSCCCMEHAAEPSCCSEEEPTPAEDPCRDCIIAISLDAGDFLWSANTFDPAPQDVTTVAPPETPFASNLHANQFAQLREPIRGSPPSGPPLFLRSTVLRL